MTATRIPHRILGLDLAKSTGVVVVSATGKLLHRRTYVCASNDEAGKCREIRDLVDALCKDHGPFSVVGIEDTFLGKNVRLLKHLNRLSGAVLVAVDDHAIAYQFLATNRARKALRLPYGPKAEVHRVLRARRTVPRGLGSDELDAYVVAIAALRLARQGVGADTGPDRTPKPVRRPAPPKEAPRAA